jgi:uncharacterized membrane protein
MSRRRSKRKAKRQDARFFLPWIGVAIFIIVGLALLFTVGRNFAFYHEDQYWHVAKIAFFVLLPIIVIARLATPADTQPDPNPRQSFVFVIINWIILTALIAGLLVFCPLGYIALFSWASGADATVNATVASVKDLKQKYTFSCKRNVVIAYGGLEPEACLADLSQTEEDIRGRYVALDIRQSSSGFTMRALRLAPQENRRE